MLSNRIRELSGSDFNKDSARSIRYVASLSSLQPIKESVDNSNIRISKCLIGSYL
jgi:hypothetical protein